MKYDKISGFSDEIGSSLEAQLQGVRETGISYISIRNVDGKSICEYTPEEVKGQILPLLLDNGIGVSSIGSPLGKIRVDDEAAFHRQIELAHNTAEIAKILNCGFVRVFSFYLPDGDPPGMWKTIVIEKLKLLVDIFEARGITVLHENEKEIYGDTPERCRELFENIRSPFFKGIFDFANFVQCGEETWRAYRMLREHIVYFHIKDALFENGETVVCGQGDGQIKKILKAAFENGYRGFLTLEPHLVLFDGLGLLERKEADEIVKKNKAASGLEAFRMQYSGLENILEEIFNYTFMGAFMEAKKICAYEVGKVRIENYKIPHIGENDVLVKTLYSTISPGTELAWINHMENTPGKYPYDPGYSCCGQIIQTGDKVTELEVGNIVVCNYIHCSEFVISEKKCTKVPESIDPREASAFRLASISLQGIRKADIQIGDRVAVLGLGPIGNLAAQLACVAGAGETTGFDFVDWRRKLAEECKILLTDEDGAREEYQSAFDVVVEATGVPQAINTALKMVKPLGKVVLLGSTRGCTDGVNFYRDVHRKGVVVIGAHEMHRSQDEKDSFGHFRSHKKDEETVINLLAQGRIHMEPLISEVTEPQRAQEIYQRLLERKEQLMLAAFRWCSE